MKLSSLSLRAIRNFSSKAVLKPEVTQSNSKFISSDQFDYIRHQVYGDLKKVDKVIVNVITEDEKIPVLINRNVSTSYHCLSHIGKQFADEAVLVEVKPSVGGSYFGSVNQPIEDQAEIRKIIFDSKDLSNMINEAYWRSCNLITGAILKDALDINIDLKFEHNSVNDSFFGIQVDGLGNSLNSDELNTINKFAKTFLRDEKLLETIAVPPSVAQENELEGSHLVRIGRHVFLTTGPVIRSTLQVGRYSIFQPRPNFIAGVSLPFIQPTSSYSWSLIVENAIRKCKRV